MIHVDTSNMEIGVFSDVHDNIELLRKALRLYRERGIDTLLFAGDFCSPIAANEMLGHFPGHIHAVFGNGDGDRLKMEHLAVQAGGRLHLHGEYVELAIAGRPVAMTHYEFYAEALAKTGKYLLAVAGHTHVRRAEAIRENVLLLNPGEVMNWKGQASCAVYNVEFGTHKFIELA